MPNLGVSELIVIFMILLLVFGASRLPALGEGLGRTIRGFKRGLSDDGDAAKPASTSPEAKSSAKPSASKSEADDAELVDKS